ncbi:LPS export ABC transporter permease LptF [Cellvibrio japonicus]|uniref:Lipopolysaccharide export system permease protein LptF n=1 Tax=Cellvibrio japonicus (strain Ueda107) TaxID=498211 RepID=B3PDJ1_CELJU|nr:LPS export ABC transporter permease LptF [Cellvibrio japonicus]ACE83747.1 putative permease, YjgP/YjgQ family superfamily [Cellvibrio japonicus Ueda107]QEI12008.1 LPS export ABC transporter permease LptF [Cellvibrio japonicus]QEI15583.1 LPS export ABC transporter permease LptF [Cellvibrio japonicus]QEI19161.1 LPS export ABC transporter permease LptF [Cellvibrio japonicus]
MIIFRYLSRDLLLTSLAVSAVLFTIFLTGKFSDYLDDAAQGKLAVDVLFTIIAYRMTGLLELILPLGFYLAILLAYGRMYMDSEMVVLSACGISPGQLVGMTLVPSALIAAIVALFSFWLSPLGAQLTEQTLAEQRNRSEFESMQPGRFQSLGQGKIMAYVESLSDDNRLLQHVFVAHQEGPDSSAIVVAETGTQMYRPDYGQRYLVLNQGYRYQGKPGTNEFTITRFEDWGRYLPPTTSVAEIELKSDAKTTAQLFRAEDNESIATLQWRISMPIMVLIATLLAVPLSKTNPRQGRYLKMLPAILVYVFYLTFLINARSAITKGNLNPALGMWVVHLPFLVIALLMINWHRLTHSGAKRARANHA